MIKNWIYFGRRLARVLVGNTLMGLGISLVISAGLGVDPWTVLTLGTSNTFGLTPGRAAQIQGIIFVASIYVVFRRKPGVGTLVNMILVGFFIDVFQGLWPTPATIPGQLAQLIGAIALIGFGVAVYVSGEMGEGPIEQLMVVLHERRGWQIGRVRVVMDSLATTIGYLLGGSVGIGTLIAALGIGPVVQLSLRKIPVVMGTKYEFRNQ